MCNHNTTGCSTTSQNSNNYRFKNNPRVEDPQNMNFHYDMKEYVNPIHRLMEKLQTGYYKNSEEKILVAHAIGVRSIYETKDKQCVNQSCRYVMDHGTCKYKHTRRECDSLQKAWIIKRINEMRSIRTLYDSAFIMRVKAENSMRDERRRSRSPRRDRVRYRSRSRSPRRDHKRRRSRSRSRSPRRRRSRWGIARVPILKQNNNRPNGRPNDNKNVSFMCEPQHGVFVSREDYMKKAADEFIRRNMPSALKE